MSLKDAAKKLSEETALDADARVALLRKENKQLRTKLREREAGLEIVRASFEEAYSEPLDIRVEKPKAPGRRAVTEHAILHLTDIHFGKETATYNSTVAAERLLTVYEAVSEIVGLRRTFARIDSLELLL